MTALGLVLKAGAAAAFSVAAALLLPTTMAAAQSADQAQPTDPNNASAAERFGLGAWSEVVVSVEDLSESSAWLMRDGGWRVASAGPIDPREIEYWGMPRNVTGAYRKICAPDTARGCIRYVRFDGIKDQKPIRPAARPWDTGGIFSIMLRSEDTQAMFDAAIKRGWWAESPPYAFSFGGSDLLNVVIRGPHGVNYALYERKSPAFTGFPVGKLSQAFNTMRMVKDQPTSLSWYRDRLGLVPLFDAPFTDPEPRANNFSVPANLATTLVRRAAVVQPLADSEDGRIELMQFEGIDGRDYSANASPPSLGIISVRYPVRDAKAYQDFLSENGVAIERSASDLRIPGLSGETTYKNLFAVRDPDGNLTEFYNAD